MTISTLKELKEIKIERTKNLLKRLNRGRHEFNRYEIKIGNSSISLKDGDFSTPYFVSKKIEEFDKQVVVLFEFYSSTRKDASTVRHAERYPKYSGNNEYEEMFIEMKTFWEEYARIKKLNGIVFVRSEYLAEGWTEYFKKTFPMSKKNSNYEELIQSNVGYSVFYALYSSDFREKADLFLKAKSEFESVIGEEQLLSGYQNDFYKLYSKELKIKYAGKDLILSSAKSDNFQNIRIIEEDETEDVISLKKDDILTFLLNIKESQRLLNLLNTPMMNFEEVLRKIGVYVEKPNPSVSIVIPGEEKIYQKFKKGVEKEFSYLETFGEWEFIESEMGFILNEFAANQGKKQPVIDKIDPIGERLYVYHFQTNNFHFYFVVEKEYVMNSNYERNVISFKVFCSEDKVNIDMKNFVNKLIFKNMNI